MIKKVEVKQSLPATLLDELRSDEIKKRSNAVSQLKVIATALGPDRTRNELVPFLNEFIEDEEQVLCLLIGSLRELTPLLGGEIHQKCLVPLLISFCKSDDKRPSDMAIDMLVGILRRQDLKKSEDFAMDVIKKLIDSDSQRGKEAGVTLLTTLIKQLNQSHLLEIYLNFCNDTNFQIRKIAAKHLKNLIMSTKDNPAILGKIVVQLLNDKQDLIKMLALDGAIKYFPDNPALVLQNIKNMLNLNSWRINMKMCEELPSLVRQLSKAQFKTYIEAPYIRFLAHEQPELRAAACACLDQVCSNMDPNDIIKNIIPQIQKLSQDPKPFVRIQISKSFLSIAQYIPKQSIVDLLLPILACFLKDPDANSSLSVFSSLSTLMACIPTFQLEQTALQCINQLFASNNWRTKCRAIEIMNQLIKFPSFLNDRIIVLIIGWAFDKIDAVRQKALGLIEILLKSMDTASIENKMIPKLLAIQNCPNYLQRQLILHIIDRTARHVSLDILNNSYFPVMLNLGKDRVPNIRYLIVKILKNNVSLLGNMRFKTLLDSLTDDKDQEIKAEVRTIIC